LADVDRGEVVGGGGDFGDPDVVGVEGGPGIERGVELPAGAAGDFGVDFPERGEGDLFELALVDEGEVVRGGLGGEHAALGPPSGSGEADEHGDEEERCDNPASAMERAAEGGQKESLHNGA
jgi:hypothetical protein